MDRRDRRHDARLAAGYSAAAAVLFAYGYVVTNAPAPVAAGTVALYLTAAFLTRKHWWSSHRRSDASGRRDRPEEY